MPISNLLSKAQKLFTQKPDQADLKQTQEQIDELNDLAFIMNSREGKTLVNWLKGEILATIDSLIKTRDKKFISDLESQLKLFNKLTSSKDNLKLIENWLSEEIEKYEQE